MSPSSAARRISPTESSGEHSSAPDAIERAATPGIVFRATTAFVLANGLWFIWSNRFIPNADYPDWVYQGHLMNQLLRGDLQSTYTLRHYPVPNSLPTIAMGIAGFLMSPEAAGKVVICLVLALFVFASIYLIKSLNPSEEDPALFLPLALTFNFWFFAGELSYLIGLSLLFLYGGYLLRRLDHPEQVSAVVVVTSLLALFFAHPIPYLVSAFISVLYCYEPRRRSVALRFLVPLGFSAAMLCWYFVGQFSYPATGSDQSWRGWTTHLFLGRYLAAFSPFLEFLPWLGIAQPGMKVAATVNLLIAMAAGCAIGACVLAGISRRFRFVSIIVLFCVAAIGGGGYSYKGWVGPGERFIYPAAWFSLCWLGAIWAGRERTIPLFAIKTAVVAVIVGQIVYLDLGVSMVSRRLGELEARMNAAKSHTEFCAIYEAAHAQSEPHAHREGFDRFLNNIFASLRLPYYGYVERGEAAPIFSTGIFDYRGSGNNEDLCK